MKRLMSILLCLVLAVSCLTACGGDKPAADNTTEPEGTIGTEASQEPAATDAGEDVTEAPELTVREQRQLAVDSVRASVCDVSVVPYKEAALKGTAFEIEDAGMFDKKVTILTVGLQLEKTYGMEEVIQDITQDMKVLNGETEEPYAFSIYDDRMIGAESTYKLVRILIAGEVTPADVMIEIHHEDDDHVIKLIQLPSEIAGFEDAESALGISNEQALFSHLQTIKDRVYYVNHKFASASDMTDDGYMFVREYSLVPMEGNMLHTLKAEDFEIDMVNEIPGTKLDFKIEADEENPHILKFVFTGVADLDADYTEEELSEARANLDRAFDNMYIMTPDGEFSIRCIGI